MTNIIHTAFKKKKISHSTLKYECSSKRGTHTRKAADIDRNTRALYFLVYIEGIVKHASDQWLEVLSMACAGAGLTNLKTLD